MHTILTPAKVAIILATVSALGACSVALAQMTPPTPGPEGNTTAYRLQTLVLQANELPTFVPIFCPLADTDVDRWGNGNRAAAGALRSDGFVIGVREPLYSTVWHGNAISVAAEFRTAQGARRDAERQLATAREVGAVTTFAVSAIPGAFGYSHSAHGKAGYRVIFTDGGYEYVVGVDSRGGLSSELLKAPLLKAARLVYSRAHGGDARRTIRVSVNHK